MSTATKICKADVDCHLAGACVAGQCLCDPEWAGLHCEHLAVGASSSAVRDEREHSWSWGGTPAQDPASGLWHLFYSFMVQTCGLLHYQTNSIVRHAVSTSPKGPWRDIGVALAPRPWPSWDFGNVHAPTVRYDATTKQWLLFYEATFWRHGAVDCRVNRTAPAVYVSRTRRIGVAAAASLHGPWRRLDAPILAPRAPSAWDSSDVSNAAPLVLPNGSVVLAYRAGGDGVALGGGIGVAVAPTWKGPYERRGPTRTRMLFAAEDPALWPAVGPRGERRGFHMLVHRFAAIPPNGSSVAAGVGGHAFSLDGLEWRYAPHGAPAYDNAVVWRGNGSRTRLYRRERPQPVIDAHGRLLGLFNGAWPCHHGREDDDAHDAAVGCASFTLWTEVDQGGTPR